MLGGSRDEFVIKCNHYELKIQCSLVGLVQNRNRAVFMIGCSRDGLVLKGSRAESMIKCLQFQYINKTFRVHSNNNSTRLLSSNNFSRLHSYNNSTQPPAVGQNYFPPNQNKLCHKEVQKLCVSIRSGLLWGILQPNLRLSSENPLSD